MHWLPKSVDSNKEWKFKHAGIFWNNHGMTKKGPLFCQVVRACRCLPFCHRAAFHTKLSDLMKHDPVHWMNYLKTRSSPYTALPGQVREGCPGWAIPSAPAAFECPFLAVSRPNISRLQQWQGRRLSTPIAPFRGGVRSKLVRPLIFFFFLPPVSDVINIDCLSSASWMMMKFCPVLLRR